MSYILATFVAAILFGSEAFGKTVTGLFKSEVAREQKGQFISKFMYQGNDADELLLTCHSDGDSVRVYYSSTSCEFANLLKSYGNKWQLDLFLGRG